LVPPAGATVGEAGGLVLPGAAAQLKANKATLTAQEVRETFSGVQREDDGSGKVDALPLAYYALRPMVEALSTVPAGCSLPTGLTLFYDPANKFPPPKYPNGIPLGKTVTSDWATAKRMCDNITAAGRFSADYAKFATCP
jgi:hypothetical protein